MEARMIKHWLITHVLTFLAVTMPVASADDHTKTVFVTNSLHSGNFGGIEAGDAICQEEADGASSIVPRATYLAWLSDGTDSPETRFAKATVPYVLPDGTIIAEDYTDLTDGSLLHQINMEPSGVSVGTQYTWTGTNANGTSARDWLTCNQWRAEPLGNFHGMGGRTERTDSLWSSRIARVGCERRHRLWCFQQ
jgi:hypothetical protein